MRTFIAIEIPAEIRAALAALQIDLRRAKADVGWTKPDNIHLTLQFLGEIEEQRISEIADVLAGCAGQFQAFTLRLNGVGVFPNARQPRVLWAGLSGEVETLLAMQRDLAARLSAIGIKGDGKAFHPHLTIGRVKSNRNARELVAQADLSSLPALPFAVHEIALVKSELLPAGARYTALARASLPIQ